jgi:uncharacterized membrane protein
MRRVGDVSISWKKEMFMHLKRIELVLLGMVVIAFALAIYFYTQMPERIASHWNSRGEVDGYQVILWNKGTHISPNVIFPIALGFLFFYIGILCEHAKRNWFIGIRTPWTLSNEKVWDKTHRLGGKLFKIAGLISLLGALLGKFAFVFVLAPMLMVTIYAIVSLTLLMQETKGAVT